MTGPITIFWKKYNSHLPALVYRSEFEYYKSHEVFPVNSKLKYLEEFWAELLLIFLVFLGWLCEKYHWYPLNGAFGLLVRGVSIVAFFGFIGLVVSTINYLNYYRESNRKINYLNNALLSSYTYEIFCSEMGRIDKRYITQYEILKND